MTPKATETSVGIFLLAGLAAFIWLTVSIGNWSLGTSKNYQLTAHFYNIGGLTVKAPVTLAGVMIGQVATIGIDANDYSARVTLRIDQIYDNLPEDTTAAILTSGLLGAQYIGLDPGGEERYLKDGDEIEITQSAVVLENLIGEILIRTAEEEDR
jgi:phospholipid/cholesterol/gamma-HCH transport system substrate-binding protein